MNSVSERSCAAVAAALAGVPRLGSRGLLKALRIFAERGPDGLEGFLAESAIFKAAPRPPSESLRESPGIAGAPPSIVEILARGEALIVSFEKSGMKFLTPWQAAYPPCLLDLRNPPPFLMCRGRFPGFDIPWVAVVGSRGPSSPSVGAARKAGRLLARMGVPVVSGLARGIDSAAHAGCLEAGGVTIAVMGSGLDEVYPPEHLGLAEEISRSGAVVSELLPLTKPEKWTFVSRNRIIAAMASAVVVVAASRDSGSLRTAAEATGIGRTVVAIVDPCSPHTHGGGAELAGSGGAMAARTPEEAVEILLNGPLAGISLDKSEPLSVYNNISINASGCEGLLRFLQDGDTPEAVTARSGLPPGKVLAGLMKLEMDGLLRRAHDGTIFLEYRGRIE